MDTFVLEDTNPFMLNNCSSGACSYRPSPCAQEDDDFDCDDCCPEEYEEKCGSNRFFGDKMNLSNSTTDPFDLSANSGGRHRKGGGGGGGGRNKPGRGTGIRPGYNGGGIQRRSFYGPVYGRRGFYGRPGYGGRWTFAGNFDALGLATLPWFSLYGDRYNYWYPQTMAPLYVRDDDYGMMVANADLSDLGAYPPQELTVPFNNRFNFRTYSKSQSLTPTQSASLESQLRSIDEQRKTLISNPSYQQWANRGFALVPDLNLGKFVWVYTGGLSNTGVYSYMHNINLACARCGGHKDEQKELVKLTHDQIVFDIYGKYGDEIYKGFYISKSGQVYAYNKSHNLPNAFEQTVIEQIPNLKVDIKQMEALVMLLGSLRNAEVKYYRHDSGATAYDGWVDGKRISIYGDNNSKSPIADEIMLNLRNIVSV